MYLLYHLLQVSSVFERNQQKSGSIQPKNILINKEGDIKVITVKSLPGMADNYSMALSTV